jgi:hypothetical protein
MKKQDWINEEDLQVITRNINDILSLHVKLLSKLEACSQNFHWENIHNRYCQLADVFITMVSTPYQEDRQTIHLLSFGS